MASTHCCCLAAATLLVAALASNTPTKQNKAKQSKNNQSRTLLASSRHRLLHHSRLLLRRHPCRHRIWCQQEATQKKKRGILASRVERPTLQDGIGRGRPQEYRPFSWHDRPGSAEVKIMNLTAACGGAIMCLACRKEESVYERDPCLAKFERGYGPTCCYGPNDERATMCRLCSPRRQHVCETSQAQMTRADSHFP